MIISMQFLLQLAVKYAVWDKVAGARNTSSFQFNIIKYIFKLTLGLNVSFYIHFFNNNNNDRYKCQQPKEKAS